jgi:hypothetical protein
MEKCYQKDIYIGVVDMEPAFRGPQRHGSWIARGFLRNLGWQQARGERLLIPDGMIP